MDRFSQVILIKSIWNDTVTSITLKTIVGKPTSTEAYWCKSSVLRKAVEEYLTHSNYLTKCTLTTIIREL